MATVDLFGWDLTYRSVENEIHKKEELLVVFTHWYIIKNGFLCIGNGDSKTLKGDEVKGETLTPGWNQNEDYNIRYMYADRLYLLRASITGGDIIFNFLRADDLCISSCVFKIEDIVKELKGDIATMIPDYKNILSVLRKELIEPIFSRITHSAAGTQTVEEKVKSPPHQRQDPFSPEAPDVVPDPLSRTPRRPPIPIPGLDPLWSDPRRDPSSVGRNDLDPFGGHGSGGRGGGMIFDPLNPRTGRNSFDPVSPNFPHGLPRGMQLCIPATLREVTGYVRLDTEVSPPTKPLGFWGDIFCSLEVPAGIPLQEIYYCGAPPSATPTPPGHDLAPVDSLASTGRCYNDLPTAATGSVPPGARFDPYNPPGTGRGGRGSDPDPDHLPPPGYDDMFM